MATEPFIFGSGPMVAPPKGTFLCFIGSWEIIMGCEDRWDAAMHAARFYSEEFQKTSDVEIMILDSNGKTHTTNAQFERLGNPRKIVGLDRTPVPEITP